VRFNAGPRLAMLREFRETWRRVVLELEAGRATCAVLHQPAEICCCNAPLYIRLFGPGRFGANQALRSAACRGCIRTSPG
jgi:hypothetical protein